MIKIKIKKGWADDVVSQYYQWRSFTHYNIRLILTQLKLPCSLTFSVRILFLFNQITNPNIETPIIYSLSLSPSPSLSLFLFFFSLKKKGDNIILDLYKKKRGGGKERIESLVQLSEPISIQIKINIPFFRAWGNYYQTVRHSCCVKSYS